MNLPRQCITAYVASILLAGCAAPPADQALNSLCAVQVVKIINENMFITRQHCEPDGERI